MSSNMNIKISAQATGLDAKLKSVSNSFSAVGRSTKAANGAMGSFYNSTRKMNQTFHNINKDANRAASGIGLFSKALHFTVGIASINMVVDALGKCINGAMDAIETQNMYSVALGDMKSVADETIDSLSAVYGLDPTNIKSSVGTYSLLAKSMGMSSAQAETLSTQIYQLALDESSLMNIPIEQVMSDLKSGLVGQSETVYKYGMDVTEAGLKTEALAEGITKSVRNMSQGEKMALRYNVMMKNGSLAVGDFARTLESPANQMKILQERVTTFSRSVGTIFINSIGAILPYLNAFMIVLTEAANAIAAFFGFAGIDTSAASKGVSSLADNTEDVANAADGATSSLKAMKNATLGLDELNVIDKTSSSGAGGGGGVGGASILDSMKLSEMYDGLDGISSKSKELANNIKAAFLPLKPQFDALVASFSSLKDFGDAFYTNVLEPIGSWVIGTGIGMLMDILTKFNTDIVPKLTAILPSIKTFITDFLNPIAAWVLGTAIPDFMDLFGDFLVLAKPIIDAVVDACVKIWNDFLKPIGSWIVGTGFDVLGAFFTTIGNTISQNPQLGGILTDIAEALLLIQGVKFLAASFSPLTAFLTTLPTVAPAALVNLKRLAGSTVFTQQAPVKGADIRRVDTSGNMGTPIGEGSATIGQQIKGALAGVAIGVIVGDWLTGSDVISVAGDVLNQIFSGAAKKAGASVGGFWTYLNNEQDMRDLWKDTPLGDFAGWVEEHLGINLYKSTLDHVVDGFSNMGIGIKQIWDDVAKGASDAWERIKTGFFNFCQDFSKGVWDIGQWFVDAWERIKSGAKDAWDRIVLGAQNTWSGITSALGSIGTWFSDRWTDITNAFSGMKKWFSDKFTEAWDAIKKVFANVGSFFTGIWDTIKSTFTDIGTKVGDAIGGAFKTSINAVLSTVENTLNQGMSFVNSIIDEYNKLPLADIGHVGMITLPRLAKGGIVTSSTIANIGEAGDEAIMPLNSNALSKYLKPIMGNGISGDALGEMTSAIIDGVGTALANQSQNEKPIVVTLDGQKIYSNQQKVASNRGLNFGMGAFAR